ncbi:unnamed protein product [Camellia sinensis]
MAVVVVVGSHSLLQLGIGKRRRRKRAPPLRPFRPSSEFIISNHSPPSFLLPPHASLPQHPKLFFGSEGGPSSSLSLHHRLKPIPALDSEGFAHDHQRSVTRNSGLEQWDALTAKFAGAANLPFLLLQIPQIVLNARNLLAGNKTALLAVPWLGMLTGLLGNLSLLSYFAKKKEKEAVMVQTLGVISIYVVIAQLAMAEAMPLPHFIVTSIVVASGLVLNFLNYFDLLSAGIWRFWEDFITVAGLSVLPQVMWSTFVPYIPNSILPGITAFFLAVVAVVMARMGKLPEKGIKFVGSISGWTATLLFMWMPVAQMWTNFLNPDNIKGLSAVSMVLAMIGNGLMIPRALFIRDFMCPIGKVKPNAEEATGVHRRNLGNCFLWMGEPHMLVLVRYSRFENSPPATAFFNSISKEFFLAATAGLYIWIGIALWRDTKVYGHIARTNVVGMATRWWLIDDTQGTSLGGIAAMILSNGGVSHIINTSGPFH